MTIQDWRYQLSPLQKNGSFLRGDLQWVVYVAKTYLCVADETLHYYYIPLGALKCLVKLAVAIS